MSLVRKLKPDRSITGAIIPLSMIPIFGIAILIFGISGGLYVLSGLLWLFSSFYLIVFLRTGNITQLLICAEGVFFGSMFFFFSPEIGTFQIDHKEWKAVYFSGAIFFGFILIWQAINRRLKWRGRAILELAAEEVLETGNGYTSRPRPVGKVDFSPHQIRSFARFCARNLITLSYTSSKNITLVPIKMGEEFGRVLGLSGDYRDSTWINFDMEGEVSVHISQRDYLDYREPLAFDQLCSSLGKVFVEFLEMYDKGEGVRVIDRMDDLKLGIFE